MKTNSFVRLACVGALGFAAATAYGQLWVNGDATSTASTPDLSFGHKFQVGGTGVTLSALGVFVGGGEPVGGVQVRLWDNSGNVVASQQFGPGVTANSTVLNNYRYYNLLSPVALTANATYTLSYWSTATEQIGNTGGTPPSNGSTFNLFGVTYLGDVVSGVTGDIRPTFAAGSGVFKGPNMIVPEPETYAFIAGLGLVGYGLYRRRQDFRG